MKKSLTAALAALLSVSLICGIAFAYGTFELSAEKQDIVKIQTPEKQPEISVKETEINGNAVNSFVNRIEKDNFTYEEHMTLESYINFLAVHTLTQSEIDEICRLVDSGTPMGTVHSIYEFYLTTNDDFTIISDIASYETRYYGKNWIENAYNNITGNKHGVIESNKAQEYLADHTHSEILYANVLSRKGIYTIDEILKKHKNGMNWNEITDAVYSATPDSKAVGSVKERLEVESFLKNDIFDYDLSPFEVYKFAFFCASNKVDVTGEVVTGDNVSQCYSIVYSKLDESTQTQAQKTLRNTDVPKTYMSDDEYFEYNSKYYNIALNNGMTENDIDNFRNKGFSMEEIARSSALFCSDPCAMIEHIKSERGDMLK